MLFSQELLLRFQSSMAQKKRNFVYYETHVLNVMKVSTVVRNLVPNLATTLHHLFVIPKNCSTAKIKSYDPICVNILGPTIFFAVHCSSC